MAAVLAVGDGAVLSHGTAAALWEFLKPIAGPIDVTVPGDGGRARRPCIRCHRSRTLCPADVTRRHGIPVTTPARTVADLEGAVEPRLRRRAIRQAEFAGHRLGAGVSSGRTRSDLERDFLRFCRHWEIPAPDVNVRVGRLVVDFLWAEAGLAVETDSWSYHRGSVAFEDDHDRDLELRRRRIDLIRVTGRQLERHPEAIATDLLEALGRAS